MAATAIGIVGESGTGKSTSLRNLDPKETFIISISGKPLPFPKWKTNYKTLSKNSKGEYEGNYYVTAKYDKIITVLNLINSKMPHIKNVIIDDFQYLIAYEFVDRATDKGFDKFSEFAQHFMNVIRYTEQMRDDCYMIFITHSENIGDVLNPKLGIKTLGKLLAEKITPEGLFTILFFTKVSVDETNKVSYQFITNNDGTCCAKSPFGMFKDLYIDNDLNEILKVVREYNE